jgi:hypothetical protein
VKRFLLLAVLCVSSVSLVRGQEAEAKTGFFSRFFGNFKENLLAPQTIHKPFAVAAGVEATQNDRNKILPELYLLSDYELSREFGFGLRVGLTFASSQPIDRLVTVMEGVIYGRFYVYDFVWIRPFVQVGLGISIDREEEYTYRDKLGEAALGARAHYKGWFAEASFRYGYPFRMAFGLGIGHSFLP